MEENVATQTVPRVEVAKELCKGCTGCGICFYNCPEPGAITVYKKGAEK